MLTIAPNISNSFGYMKCGEILKTRQTSQDPYILRCVQCQEIYLLLESFILHFEDECNVASSTKKRIRKTKTVKDSPDKTKVAIQEDENPAVKLESNNQMQMEDPLIVVKNEADDDNSIFEEDSKLQESGTNELLENPESNFFMVSEYHTPDDDDDGETSVDSQDDNESEDKESDKAQFSIMTKGNNIMLNSQNLTTHETVSTSSFPEVQNMKHLQPVTFEEMLTQFSTTIEPMFITLTNEVSSLRNEVKELKNDKSKIQLVMPENPYKLMDDFLNFEKQLQEDRNFLDLFEKELLTVAKSPNFTKNCWRRLLVDELAEKLCWKGTEEKKSVRSLSTAKSIRNAAISAGLAEDDYIKSTKSFFQFAKNRQELKKKYKAKFKSQNNIQDEQ